jgi:hypothetical protein
MQGLGDLRLGFAVGGLRKLELTLLEALSGKRVFLGKGA